MAPTEVATSLEIALPQPTALVAEMNPIVSLARTFEVTDVESDRLAQEYGQQLRRAEKSWTEYCEPARAAADVAKKKVLALRDGILGPWSQARSIFFAKSDAYQAEQRKKAEEEQRRLQALARKQEEDSQLAAAQLAQDAGDHEAAEAIASEPVAVPVIYVAPQVAKVAGVSSRQIWSAEIHSKRCSNYAGIPEGQNCKCYDAGLLELVQYVAAHPEWINLIEPAMPNLNRLAVAQHNALSIPGVRGVSKTSRASR